MAARISMPKSPALRPVLSGAPRLVGKDGRGSALAARDAAVLAYLALEGPTSRRHLIDMLWPEAEPDLARNALRQRLFQLNRRAGGDLVIGGELLELAERIGVDGAAAESEPELLHGCDCADWPLFEQWLDARRAERASAGREALAAAAESAERDGRLGDAQALAAKILALAPLHEDGHRRVMRIHYLNGDRAAAIAAFEHCERLLKDELGVKPGPALRALLHTVEGAAAAVPTRRPGSLPATVLRPPRLIGRAAELAAVLSAAVAGRGVWLVGEAGMGKSRLLAEWAGDMPAALLLRARPDDAATPYATLARALRALLLAVPSGSADVRASALAAVLPELAAGPARITATPAQLRKATAALVATAMHAGMEWLVVDDLHFADEASIGILAAVIDGEVALRVAFAERPGEGSPAAAALRDALLDARAVELVTLSPLDAAALHELITSLGLPDLDADRLAPLLAQHSGGNPLYVLETLKQMVLDGPSARLPRPSQVGLLIEKRLRRLSLPALALARIAAVAGTDFSVPLAESLLTANALELADAWAELEAAQVFRAGGFAHDLVHDAALRLVPQPVAQALHRRIAAYVERAGGTVERVAHHWRGALDAERAVPALRAAAQAALALFQRPAALLHLEQAVSFLLQLGRASEAFALQLDVLALLQGHDSGVRHEAAVERLRQIAVTPGERVRCAIALAILRHIQGREEDALLAIESCRDDAATAAAPDRSELCNVLGTVLRSVGRVDAALAAHREALALARAAELRDALPGCLNNLALALLEANDAAQAAQAFDESARLERDPMTRARVLNNLGIAREEGGQPQAALEARRDALDLLRGQDGVEFARANILTSMVGNARVLQRYAEALALLDEADRTGLPATHWRTSSLHGARAALWIDLGVFDRADAAITSALQSAASDGALADALLIQAGCRLARGSAATDLLDRCDALLRTRADRRTIRLARFRRALASEPEAAKALATQELELEAAYGNRAAQVPFGFALVQAELAQGNADAALAAAERAVETMRTAHPLLVTPIEVRHALWKAMCATGHAGAPALIVQLEGELLAVADQHVPSEFRHSFLRSVRFNQQLLRDAVTSRASR